MKNLKWLIETLNTCDQLKGVKMHTIADNDFVGINIVVNHECGFVSRHMFHSMDEARAFLSGIYQIATWNNNKDKPF